jgi:hypothetical protein
MEWLRNLSDNELAVLGCFGALVVSFGLVGGSYHLRRIFRQAPGETDALQTSHPASLAERRSTERRAA